MTTYVALLRGINVGGRTKVGMEDLRRLFTDLGHVDVRTYIQSGNVIFRSPAKSGSGMAGEIETRLTRDLGVTSTVLLRTAAELDRVLHANPFSGEGHDLSKVHVTFLAGSPAGDHLERPPGEPADLAVVELEVYLYCPEGYGRTKLNNAYVEKELGVPATTRGWKTVLRLHELAGG